ncbi:MAG: DnaJ domain-containing protein [Myxococcales bacterium]|nr:DnaJ domain-containing protein [Myxococcales bacterium]
MHKDPYTTLGVNSTATQAEIQAAYKRKARELHPDVNHAADAEERFRELVDAYELLRDEAKRARYDAFGKTGGSRSSKNNKKRRRADTGSTPFTDFGFDDIRVGRDDLRNPFDDFLRQRTRRRTNSNPPPKPRSKKVPEVHLTLPLEHAYTGTTIDMAVELPNARGLKQAHNFRLKVPKGAKNGDRLKLKDPEVTVILRLETPEGVDVEGRDVRTSVHINPWEAALGAEVDIPLPKGSLRIKIPAGTSSGQKLRLRGQGIPQKPGRDGEPGDLYVQIQIAVPTILTEEEREAFEHLRTISTFDPRQS